MNSEELKQALGITEDGAFRLDPETGKVQRDTFFGWQDTGYRIDPRDGCIQQDGFVGWSATGPRVDPESGTVQEPGVLGARNTDLRINPNTGIIQKEGWFGLHDTDERIDPNTGVLQKRGFFGWPYTPPRQPQEMPSPRPATRSDAIEEQSLTTALANLLIGLPVRLALGLALVMAGIYLAVAALAIVVTTVVVSSPVWLGMAAIGSWSAAIMAPWIRARLKDDDLDNVPVTARGKQSKPKYLLDRSFLRTWMRWFPDRICILGFPLAYGVGVTLLAAHYCGPGVEDVVLIGGAVSVVVGLWLARRFGRAMLLWRIGRVLFNRAHVPHAALGVKSVSALIATGAFLALIGFGFGWEFTSFPAPADVASLVSEQMKHGSGLGSSVEYYAEVRSMRRTAFGRVQLELAVTAETLRPLFHPEDSTSILNSAGDDAKGFSGALVKVSALPDALKPRQPGEWTRPILGEATPKGSRRKSEVRCVFSRELKEFLNARAWKSVSMEVRSESGDALVGQARETFPDTAFVMGTPEATSAIAKHISDRRLFCSAVDAAIKSHEAEVRELARKAREDRELREAERRREEEAMFAAKQREKRDRRLLDVEAVLAQEGRPGPEASTTAPAMRPIDPARVTAARPDASGTPDQWRPPPGPGPNSRIFKMFDLERMVGSAIGDWWAYGDLIAYDLRGDTLFCCPHKMGGMVRGYSIQIRIRFPRGMPDVYRTVSFPMDPMTGGLGMAIPKERPLRVLEVSRAPGPNAAGYNKSSTIVASEWLWN